MKVSRFKIKEMSYMIINIGFASILGYVHTAAFSFLSVFVDENAARSHCSVFK